MPPPEPRLPLPEMSAAQLARYRRALVRYLRRCRTEQPQYREMRACLADVMAEEQARRLTDHADTHDAGAADPHVMFSALSPHAHRRIGHVHNGELLESFWWSLGRPLAKRVRPSQRQIDLVVPSDVGPTAPSHTRPDCN